MRTDFIPSREADLSTWSTNFHDKITATPTAYGLTAAQATNYGTLHVTFEIAYQTAKNPDTRSPSNIVTKDTAKRALIDDARMLARIIQANPAVTDTQRSELGLTVRAQPKQNGVPGESPILEVMERMGTNVRTRLHDGSGSRRGRPEGVQGASLFSFVGAEPPAEVEGWKFEGNTTRTIIDVEFPVTLAAGTSVWLTAFWYNPRGESGPGCAPVRTYLAGGGMAQAA